MQMVGVTNGGYWGVNIAPHGIYRVSLYLKAANDLVRCMQPKRTTRLVVCVAVAYVANRVARAGKGH